MKIIHNNADVYHGRLFFADLIVGEDTSDSDNSRKDNSEVEVIIRGLLIG